jgi:hypothetical protein
MSDFKQASKEKLRFSTSKGNLTVEQLWDLTLTDLATCIKGVKKVLKGSSEDDDLAFLDSNITVDKTQQLRFDILKDVYLTKKQEADDRKTAKEVKEHNQKILALIAEKQEEGLKGKSIEDLEKMLK